VAGQGPDAADLNFNGRHLQQLRALALVVAAILRRCVSAADGGISVQRASFWQERRKSRRILAMRPNSRQSNHSLHTAEIVNARYELPYSQSHLHSRFRFVLNSRRSLRASSCAQEKPGEQVGQVACADVQACQRVQSRLVEVGQQLRRLAG